MKPAQRIEAAVMGVLLATAYFFALERFAGMWQTRALLPLACSAVAMAWLYSVLRFTVRDGDSWFFAGRKYHTYELGHFLWPALFGAIAGIAVIAAVRDFRLALGWGLPILAAMTYGAYRYDLRRFRNT